MHDIVIRNADVIDGTGKPALRADVAVAEGRIADVGDLDRTEGKLVIDRFRITYIGINHW